MSKPLPEWCPRVDFNPPRLERCGVPTILNEIVGQYGERRHHCYLKVGPEVGAPPPHQSPRTAT
jgi:hypothetical protein